VIVPGVADEGRYGNRSARRLTSLWDSWRRMAATETMRGQLEPSPPLRCVTNIDICE
jgi:hypothetical protein